MDHTQALSIIVAGIVVPFLTQIAIRPGWSADQKRAAAAVCAAVCGLVAAIAGGTLDGIPEDVTGWVQRLLIGVAGVVALSQGYFELLRPVLDGGSDTSQN